MAPKDWKQHPVVQVEGGFLAGLALGLVPGAGVGHTLLDGAGALPYGSPEARLGLAVGQVVGGIFGLVGGLAGEVGGGISSTTGIGAALGVPVIAVSTVVVVGSVGNIASGLHGLTDALLSKGSGSGSDQEGPVHHVATNKNPTSTARGGPWTPRFKEMFGKAGMTLEDAENKIAIPGHQGPHPEAYHQEVFERLERATDGLSGEAYSVAFRAQLEAIRTEAATAGTYLNDLVTKQ